MGRWQTPVKCEAHGHPARGAAGIVEWLPDMDLNHDKQIQSLLCYRYTIGQDGDLRLRKQGKESRRERVSGNDSSARGLLEAGAPPPGFGGYGN